ncbi:NADH-quinone oxidoreductase subunit NuoG [Thalassomonas viridans]|uniref:NADH-quinone oxidoreductase subunit G n=1 Tax=Thalassomonas viridans TaxID=137584 RepID=A0AAE9Z0K8_9GAMM|nr:NADH-quinone oxidoreductase subunit NuoG [Thalassomonas viridans]WDE03829.1 NADH-quinone oxidoreductase subunit NuoG [Thalassomonas viridans]
MADLSDKKAVPESGPGANANRLTVYIDDQAYQVDKNDNLLAGVLANQLNLPYFCWHPSMGSVGACRQCAVTQYQDENDTRGRIVMACMTPVTDGMRIGLKEAHASEFREQVIAAMMTNHPHDCPVCAEGGECHLQDMTVMTGHSARHYSGKKRTFTNQYLGELVGHEMNRCITCYRCVRFYKDYAGGKDLDVFGVKNQVYFGRQTDGALESEFSGNLVEVCPTGVFTNKLFSAHYTRKWDLQSAPSVCAHCAVGCNTSIGERYGVVRRVVNRYNEQLNGYFLCDRGRFGIGFVNGEQRIRSIKGIRQQSPEKLTKLDVAKALVHFKGQKFIGIGSGRASLEANSYLKNLVGADNFSAGFNAGQMALAAQHKLMLHRYPMPGIPEIEQSDLVLVIGEDITQTSPRIALAVRQALRNAGLAKAAAIGIPSWHDSAVRTVGGKLLSPLFSLQGMPTKLDDVCQHKLLLATEDIVQTLLALNRQLSRLLGLKGGADSGADDEEISPERQAFISELIPALLKANSPLVVSGWSLESASLFAAINRLMDILHSDACAKYQAGAGQEQTRAARLALLPDLSNSTGLLHLTDEQTLSLEQVLSRLNMETQDKQDKVDGLIIVENELAALSRAQLARLREQVDTLIVMDHSQTSLTEVADIVMPAAPVSEGDGHYVNYQGLCQRYYQVHAPVLPVQDSWRWLNLLEDSIFNLPASGGHMQHKFREVHSLSELMLYLGEQELAWPQMLTEKSRQQGERQVARQSHRASGRTARMANINVHEAKATQSPQDPFSFSMEGRRAEVAADRPFSWAPGWNSNQSVNLLPSDVSGSAADSAADITANIAPKLDFTCSDPLLEKWPFTALSRKEHQEQRSEALTFVDHRQWFENEWQSAVNPEFRMLSKGLQLTVASSYAREHNWQPGEFVAFSFSLPGESEPRQGIARLLCHEQLPQDLVTGNILAPGTSAGAGEIRLASVDPREAEQYRQQEQSRLQQAKNDKRALLERLKAADQTIPIRMVAGGLEDV